MRIKSDAIINLVDQTENLLYCCIMDMDAKKSEARVRVENNHHLQSRDKVNLESYDEKRGVLLYQGTVNRTTAVEVYIDKLFLVDENQRRADVRVKVDIPLTLKAISNGGKVIKLGKNVFLQALNVSAGGILLKSDLNIMDENAGLLFDFPWGQKHCAAKRRLSGGSPKMTFTCTDAGCLTVKATRRKCASLCSRRR
jgi:hypothetical protein